MKNVLIITYYWPPAGGPGVQRILKFAKYLPHFGWRPLILTVSRGEYPAIDPSLENDVPKEAVVFKTGSLEPGQFYKRFVGMQEESAIPVSVLAEEKTSLKQSLAHWVRLNMFVPDAKIGWLPFAVSEGKKIIAGHQPDLIFTSSPPPTVHLIARKLKSSSGIKWIADFRDPWTDIHYYENQKRLGVTKNIDRALEQKVLERADKIICISQLDIALDFSKKISADKCVNIPNGYDEEDFQGLEVSPRQSRKFTLLHLGAVGSERNPLPLFDVIKSLYAENFIGPDSFTLRFIGKVEQEIIDAVDRAGISNLVDFVAYMPHTQAIEQTLRASAMLLLVTQSRQNLRILPGKTFEYLRTGLPVLALGPEDGEVDRIIKEVNGGRLFAYSAADDIKSYLVSLISGWRENKYQGAELKVIQKYDRKNLTAELVKIFEQVR